MEKAKTPWDNLSGEKSKFIKNLNKSEKRLKREKFASELASTDEGCACGSDYFCKLKKVGFWLMIILIGVIIFSAVYNLLLKLI